MAPQIGGSASDGTYNPKLGAFLLPPLVGLPYPDMVANGMFPPLVPIFTRLGGLLIKWSALHRTRSKAFSGRRYQIR